MKTPKQSKTIWVGAATTILSVLALMAEFWSLLTYEQVELMNQYFGPELVAIIGAVMVALRVITSSPLVWNPPEEPEE